MREHALGRRETLDRVVSPCHPSEPHMDPLEGCGKGSSEQFVMFTPHVHLDFLAVTI